MKDSNRPLEVDRQQKAPRYTSFHEVVTEAQQLGRAVGAFTCYNATQAIAVLAAAEERDRSVILLLSAGAFESPHGQRLALVLVDLAARSSVPAVVQIDHATDLRSIRAALGCGVGAVMADGAKLPTSENRELVTQTAAVAAAYGAGVEAELGYIAGDEDSTTVERVADIGAFTDPEVAQEFCAGGGVDCLAVAVGNVHGKYRFEPRLDWPLLATLREEVAVPLSLHGASGLASDDIRRAVATGVAKVNINTELREAYVTALTRALADVRGSTNLLSLEQALISATRRVVDEKMDLLEATS